MTYTLPYDVLHDFEPIALLAITPQLIIARKNFPANNVKELIAWLKANPDKATRRHGRRRRRRAGHRGLFPAGDRDTLRVRALSRRRAGDAGSGRRPGRYHVRSGRERHRPGAQRHDQGLCRPDQGPLVGAARCSIDRRGGRAVALRLVLARLVGAEGHAEGRRRQAQCRGGATRWPIRPYGSALPISGQEIWPRDQQTPEALAAHHKAETEKWWPIIRASNLKAE